MERSFVTRLSALVAVLTGVLAFAGQASAAAPQWTQVCSHGLGSGLAGCDAIKLLDPASNWHGSRSSVAPSGKGSSKHPGKGPGEEPKEEGPFVPAGYGPAELRSAYGLAAASEADGSTQTVAIVDAYDDPSAEADLNVYRKQFNLGECTAADGCFAKVNEEGGSSLPQGNSSWGQEISLDLDMASAICPHCKILLVEALSNGLEDLGIAASYAAEHANAVSNSYGGSEFSEERSFDRYYDHPGVAITVSAGDSGYGAEYPASSPYVTAVGGTTLKASGGGWSQSVWSGSGAGCSTIEPNPGWQPSNECSGRTVADTSADANPNTGVAVYDSYGQSGWLVFGGTSVSSPIIASIYGLAENASTAYSARALYGDSALTPISEGYDTNAHRCHSYLCGAPYSLSSWSVSEPASLLSGWYNGPTGDGTPYGLTGF